MFSLLLIWQTFKLKLLSNFSTNTKSIQKTKKKAKQTNKPKGHSFFYLSSKPRKTCNKFCEARHSSSPSLQDPRHVILPDLSNWATPFVCLEAHHPFREMSMRFVVVTALTIHHKNLSYRAAAYLSFHVTKFKIIPSPPSAAALGCQLRSNFITSGSSPRWHWKHVRTHNGHGEKEGNQHTATARAGRKNSHTSPC